MNIEQIAEPIRVLAAFEGGRARPLRFEWNERTYKIDAINGTWIDRQADRCNLHYSVQVGDETYYLHFAERDVQWWLDQVIVSGVVHELHECHEFEEDT